MRSSIVKPNKGITALVLMFILLLQGCAFLGIDLTEDRTITVVKSPYLINVSGDIEEKDQQFVADTLLFLSKQPYKYHKFEAVQIQVTGSESDIKQLKQNSDIINDNDDDYKGNEDEKEDSI